MSGIDLIPDSETVSADEIRDLRENGPRTLEYLNNCDMALAALRGEFGAGSIRAQKALEWCAEKIRERDAKAAHLASEHHAECCFDEGYEGVDESTPPPGYCQEAWDYLTSLNDDPMSRGAPIDELYASWEKRHAKKCKTCEERLILARMP